MSDHLPGIGFDSRYEHNLASPEVRRKLASVGTPMAVAAENLHDAARHFFNPAQFDLMIATRRPELWQRMNRRPSLMRRMLRRG